MTQTQVKRFLLGFFLVLYSAVFLRVDFFPLSWVPMYGVRNTAPILTVAVGDLERRKRGFAATRANGEQLFVSRKLLNMPPANFRRLYQERAFGEGPPQHGRERLALMPFNRWWHETLLGQEQEHQYQAQLLKTVNDTLGHDADDPLRIVQLESQLNYAFFTREHLATGDLSHPATERRTAIITPEGTRILREPGQPLPAP
ncbi:MAG: hypothetical protein V4709_11415 [Pseudomonadota bacterium]